MDKDGRGRSELKVWPVRIIMSTQAKDGLIGLKLIFSHNMVDSQNVGRPLEPADMPFILEPPLPLIGTWTDQRTLDLSVKLDLPEYWAKVSDQVFNLTWTTGLTSLIGLPIAASNELEFGKAYTDHLTPSGRIFRRGSARRLAEVAGHLKAAEGGGRK